MKTWLRIREAPALAPTNCSNRGCRRRISVGEPITTVADERRCRDAPNADDARGYICADCTSRLGSKLVTPPPRAPLPRPAAEADSW